MSAEEMARHGCALGGWAWDALAKSRGLPLYIPAKSGLSELFVFVMVGALDRALSLADFPGHVSYILLTG